MDNMIVGLIFILWLVITIVIGIKAKKNGRLRLYVVSLIVYIICSILVGILVDSVELLFFALILTPLAGGAILLIVGKKKGQQPVSEDDTKKCPFCAEIIKKDALVCRFCGKEIPSQKTNEEAIKKLSNSIFTRIKSNRLTSSVTTEIKSNRDSFFIFLSILFMTVSVFLSLLTYTRTALWGFIEVPEDIRPGALSTILAVLIYSSLVVRRIIQLDFTTGRNLNSVMKIILHCLNILFIASFLSLFVSDQKTLFLGISPMAILYLGVILSWLGVKSIAGYVWIFLFILSIKRMSDIDVAMGFTGAIYILSAFLSIAFQFIPNNKFSELGQTFNSDFKVAKAEVQEDLQSAKETTEKIVKSAGGKSVNRNFPKEGEEPVLVTDEKSD
ncbi:MAG: zinc ribbon domain-containing protein [Treponema sp.]|nr:zinc ribbon domain-containing protein [Treponema sp.]